MATHMPELRGPLLRWLAVPVGLAWAALLCWRSVRLAQQRLESDGSEIFAPGPGAGELTRGVIQYQSADRCFALQVAATLLVQAAAGR